MDFRISLACSYMMMECPRCGFTQPKDQYCAKCGTDMDAFAARPKPLLVRIVQNPNVHLSLILALIVLIAGYIIFSRPIVKRGVERLFSTPIASRDAGEPGADLPPPPPPPQKREAVVETVAETNGTPVDTQTETQALATKAAPETTKMEVTTWEVPRESLTAALTGAEKLGESNGGRAYLLKESSKAIEALSSAGRRVGGARTVALENGAQLAIETPPTTPESFQFGMYFQVSKVEGKDVGVKWESSMVLPPAEAAVDPNAAAVARQPSVRALTETQMNGSASPSAHSAVLIVFEPTNRALRDDALAKAGDGPWTIFGSYEYRSGATEWVTVVQLK